MTFRPHAWTERASDPNDVLVAERMAGARPKVGLLGIPFDGAVIGRKGAREGPAAIRRQMARLKPWTLEEGELSLSVRDWGDVVVPDATQAAHEATEAAAKEVLAAGQLPLALGGDHSLTFPLVKAHGRRLGIINLDAHLDVREVVAGQLNSGQSFGRLLEAGIVPGENLVEMGVRDLANSPRYAEKARKAGATLVGADAWAREGLAAVDRAIATASRGVDGVYLSVDIDVLDQAHAPGVSAPTPGGVDTRALFAAVRRIAERAPLVGADVVEVAPPLDRDDMTSRAAAYAVLHLLAGLR